MTVDKQAPFSLSYYNIQSNFPYICNVLIINYLIFQNIFELNLLNNIVNSW